MEFICLAVFLLMFVSWIVLPGSVPEESISHYYTMPEGTPMPETAAA
jgi:hypothetical protein